MGGANQISFNAITALSVARNPPFGIPKVADDPPAIVVGHEAGHPIGGQFAVQHPGHRVDIHFAVRLMDTELFGQQCFPADSRRRADSRSVARRKLVGAHE